jgi:thiamine biosynthesis lipoprotein
MLTVLVLSGLGPAGCAPAREADLSRYSYTQIHMGVETRVVLYATDEPAARSAAAAAFARVARLDAVMSDYRQDSELNRLCEAPAGRWTPISDDLYGVLELALQVSQATDGAFDCTVGPLSRLWREARRDGILPDPQRLAAARARVGWRLLGLDPVARAANLRAAGMRLDLGGIGKGFAAQEASRVLRERGVPRHMVALAGDVTAGAPPPGESGWRVVVETGYGAAARPLARLADASISTSGDAEQFVEIGGVRYSHVLDPRTGLGLTTRTAATVVAPDGASADALASAACVLGPDAAAAVLDRTPGVGVRMVVDGVEHRFGPAAGLISELDAPEGSVP